jgi:hypothetical protein
MMKKMGYEEGKGLGKDLQGQAETLSMLNLKAYNRSSYLFINHPTFKTCNLIPTTLVSHTKLLQRMGYIHAAAVPRYASFPLCSLIFYCMIGV